MGEGLRALVWHLVLKPLIVRNYRLRALGRLPDEWYWVDEVACKWGYAIRPDSWLVRWIDRLPPKDEQDR